MEEPMEQQVRSWLGDTQATDEQVRQIAAAWEQLHTLWEQQRTPDDVEPDGTPEPDPDQQETATGAAMLILGDKTLKSLGDAWHRALAVEQDAKARLKGAALAAYQQGANISQIADQIRASRQTVYTWFGHPTR